MTAFAHGGPPRLAIGVDVVACGRLRASLTRHGEAFADVLFAPGEWPALVQANACPARSFAAKEAFAKALGTGLASGVELTDVDARDPARGLVVRRRLATRLAARGARWWTAVEERPAHHLAIVWVGED